METSNFDSTHHPSMGMESNQPAESTHSSSIWMESTGHSSYPSSMADMETSNFDSTHHPSMGMESSQPAESTHSSSIWMESTGHSSYPSSMADMETSNFDSSFHTSHMQTSSSVSHSSTGFPMHTSSLMTPNPATHHPSQPETFMMDYDYDETSMGMNPSMGMMNPSTRRPRRMRPNTMHPNTMQPNTMDPNMMDPNMMGMYNPNVMMQDDFSMEEDYSMEDYGSMGMTNLYNVDPNMPEMEMAAEMNPLTYIDFSKPAVQAVAIGSAILFSATIFCWMMRAAERRKQTTYQ